MCIYASLQQRRQRSPPAGPELNSGDGCVSPVQNRVPLIPASTTGPALTSSSSSSSAVADPGAAAQPAPFTRDLGWFLSPSAWSIAYHYQPPPSLPSTRVFTNFIRGVQAWLVRFLRESHNPFIHRHLYSETDMPRCMQDAYSAIAIAQTVTTENEHMVDPISSSHVSNLLACQLAEDPFSLPLLSTKEHLARTQALLIHLLLALFSTSISRRANAESFIETLQRWTGQLWESAALDAATSPLWPTTCLRSGNNSVGADDLVSDLYQAFVLSESVRRTWLLCNIVIGVYHSLKGTWSTCGGDIYITTSAELWNAPSSARWEAIARHTDPLFVQSLRGQSLLARGVRASQVDEFARHLFTVMWGLEKVENWVAQTGLREPRPGG